MLSKTHVPLSLESFLPINKGVWDTSHDQFFNKHAWFRSHPNKLYLFCEYLLEMNGRKPQPRPRHCGGKLPKLHRDCHESWKALLRYRAFYSSAEGKLALRELKTASLLRAMNNDAFSFRASRNPKNASRGILHSNPSTGQPLHNLRKKTRYNQHFRGGKPKIPMIFIQPPPPILLGLGRPNAFGITVVIPRTPTPRRTRGTRHGVAEGPAPGLWLRLQ